MTMKRKSFKPKIRPFKGFTVVDMPFNDADNLIDFITGMGYLIYEYPSNCNCAIISDKVLTYGDVKKNASRLDVDLDWWNNETDFNDRLNDELDEFSY